MTTQMSCSEKTNAVKNYGFSGKYFLGELRRSWPFAVFIFVVFLLFMPVLVMMTLNSSMPSTIPGVREYTSADRLEYVIRHISSEEIHIFWGVLTTAFAMLSGWIICKYLTNKVHSDFVHCLPIRREAVFATKFLTTAIDFVAGLLLSVILTVIVCLASANLGTYGLGSILSVLFGFFLKALLLYFTVFIITNLACMLSGTLVMQIFLTFFLNFAPAAYYLMVYGIAYTYANNLRAEYYWSFDFATRICPILKIFNFFVAPVSALDVFGIILLCVVVLFITIVLYKVRKVERAGTPIVFAPVENVLKYLCVIPCTFFLGLLLEAMGGEEGWRVIGYIFGALLSFMFMNFILTKNARKIFAGVKGLAIYGVFAVLFAIGCSCNLFGIDTYVPKSADLESVVVSVNGGIASNLEIKEYKLKTEILEYYRDYVEGESYKNSSGGNVAEVYVESADSYATEIKDIDYDEMYTYHLSGTLKNGEEYYSTFNFSPDYYHFGSGMTFVFKLENGIHFAVRMYSSSEEAHYALLRDIANSREFSKQMVDILDMEKIDFACYSPLIPGREDIYYYGNETDKSEETVIMAKMIEALKKEYSETKVLEMSSVIVGEVRLRTKNDNIEFRVPVYSSFDDLWLFTASSNEEELIEDRVEKTEFMMICDVTQISSEKPADDCTVLITDKEQMREIFKSMYAANEYYGGAYIDRESQYAIAYVVTEDKANYYEEDGETGTYTTEYRTWFKNDKVPSFVPELFN